ncbi:MAG: HK97 family phage prohead protease [Alphaproteobacteria bacterium]|nr:MAG: HK97 family phage prohead protease [Alphaproteobacteria bacterium]
MPPTTTLDRQILELPLEVKTGAAPGSFSGYGAIFGNLDRDGDIVARGAFTESLKARMPVLLWQHDAKEPIGRFDLVREDEHGLYVEGRLSMTGRGLEAYALLKMGALDGLSIGFVARDAARDAASGVRTITRADLMEISLVTFPANDLARVSAVKSAGMTAGRAPGGDDIASLVQHLQTRRARLTGFERKNSKVMDAYEGRKTRYSMFYSISKAWITVSIRPRDPDVDFNARIEYHFWGENGPIARSALLYGDAGRKGHLSERLQVRDEDAGVAEMMLGGRHGSITKSLQVEIEALRGSTSYDFSVT